MPFLARTPILSKSSRFNIPIIRSSIILPLIITTLLGEGIRIIIKIGVIRIRIRGITSLRIRKIRIRIRISIEIEGLEITLALIVKSR